MYNPRTIQNDPEQAPMASTVPQPGDFAVVPVHGTVGKLIGLGEHLNGDQFDVWQHAFIYVGGARVEAEPGGARLRPTDPQVFGAAYPTLWSSGVIPLTTAQRTAICKAARGYLGVPYSGLDYLALAAHRLHLWAPGLKSYVATSKHMICSQLVDQCYADAGVHLFTDNRWPGFVTPAALAGLITPRAAMEGASWTA
jgi:hypothetical protein